MHLVFRFSTKVSGPWFQSKVEIQYKFTNESLKRMWTGVPVCPSVHEAKLSVWSVCLFFLLLLFFLFLFFLGGTGRTVGRAGVRRRAGLLLVLGCAVRLQGRHCR